MDIEKPKPVCYTCGKPVRLFWHIYCDDCWRKMWLAHRERIEKKVETDNEDRKESISDDNNQDNDNYV